MCSILYNIVITESDILHSINRLKINYSCGPGGLGLPSILFKSLKHCLVLVQPLAVLFNQLIFVGAVPDEWLTPYIVPVFKKGAAGDISNYRPISLTCIASNIIWRGLLPTVF